MQCDLLSRRQAALDTTAELKEIFRAGWSNPARVAGWIGSGLYTEFIDPACRQAWKDALAQAFEEGPPREVLDIGTGPGTIAQLWAEMGCSTTGVDFSPAMLEAARRSAREKELAITFLEGDAEAPPLRRKRFDAISSRFVLFTLPHPGYAVRRWVEMLRSGGTLVLIGHERHASAPPPRPRKAAADKWSITAQYSDALRKLPFTDHTAAHLGVVMEAAGLRDIERLPLEELIHTRSAWRRQQRPDGMGPDTPYIVVGRK